MKVKGQARNRLTGIRTRGSLGPDEVAPVIWGGEFRAEFVPAPGDKKHGIHKLIVIGLIAHTCIEATVRYAAELGYDVTVVKDATADYSDEMMHAALDINIPNYASAIVTTSQIVASISAATVMRAN